MNDEQLPIAVVAPSNKKRGGYPTYSTETCETYGYNIRDRQNMLRAGFKNGYDLHPLNPPLNDLEFVVPLYRRDSLGYRKQYPERLPEQRRLGPNKYLAFPPTAPRHPYSQGKYKVDIHHRPRLAPDSKYKYYDWNVPPSEFDIYRYPTKELVQQQRDGTLGRSSQQSQQLSQSGSRQPTPQSQRRESTPMRATPQGRTPIPKLNGLNPAPKPLRSTYQVY
jgi:hypothetical protein